MDFQKTEHSTVEVFQDTKFPASGNSYQPQQCPCQILLAVREESATVFKHAPGHEPQQRN